MRADGHDTEVIIVTGHAEVETAIEALKLKAFDYILKPFRFAELVQVVNRAAEHRRLTARTACSAARCRSTSWSRRC